MKMWNWVPSSRPKRFKTALRVLMEQSEYTLTVRTLAIAAGCSRWQVQEWLDGLSLPSDKDMRDIAGAFCLNRFGRVTCKERNLLLAELLIISTTERTK